MLTHSEDRVAALVSVLGPCSRHHRRKLLLGLNSEALLLQHLFLDSQYLGSDPLIDIELLAVLLLNFLQLSLEQALVASARLCL